MFLFEVFFNIICDFDTIRLELKEKKKMEFTFRNNLETVKVGGVLM